MLHESLTLSSVDVGVVIANNWLHRNHNENGPPAFVTASSRQEFEVVEQYVVESERS